MNSTQPTVDAGWFQDPVRPWIAHKWDGQQWTGEARKGDRLVTAADVPTSPPQSTRRVDLDDLPRRSPSAVPVGVFPLGAGVLIALVLLPSLYDRLQSVIYGAPLDVALPLGLVLLLLVALGLVLYGIVALAVRRATRP